ASISTPFMRMMRTRVNASSSSLLIGLPASSFHVNFCFSRGVPLLSKIPAMVFMEPPYQAWISASGLPPVTDDVLRGLEAPTLNSVSPTEEHLKQPLRTDGLGLLDRAKPTQDFRSTASWAKKAIPFHSHALPRRLVLLLGIKGNPFTHQSVKKLQTAGPVLTGT